MKLLKTNLVVLFAIIIAMPGYSQVETPDKIDQINMAVLAAPEEGRESAHVYGYDQNGKFVTLRKGNGEFVCIADNPNKSGFEVVSYHKELEPFMARGRQLKTEGKSFKERGEIREAEVKNGKLKMPDKPSTLHVYYGKDAEYIAESQTIKGATFRYVVYIPFATQKSTGLSLKPNAPGHPWLMDPGKHNAHIMITPPAKAGD